MITVALIEEDSILVQRTLSGNQEAFRLLYRRHVGPVRRLVYQMTTDSQVLDDLTQDVFLKVHRNLSKFRGDAQFSTWLFRIAYNVCQDYHRRKGRSNKVVSLPVEDLPISAPDAEILSRVDRQEWVSRALETLTPDHRAVVILHDLQEKPQEEVAQILEVPVGTIKSRLFYGRRKLKEWFSAQGVYL
jgi:RNA polymerase sigma-70 factor (ECF subfamily)